MDKISLSALAEQVNQLPASQYEKEKALAEKERQATLRGETLIDKTDKDANVKHDKQSKAVESKPKPKQKKKTGTRTRGRAIGMQREKEKKKIAPLFCATARIKRAKQFMKSVVFKQRFVVIDVHVKSNCNLFYFVLKLNIYFVCPIFTFVIVMIQYIYSCKN